MVKLNASLLSFTLTTSLALALPLPSYNDGLEEFSGREYLTDDLAAREPGIFDDLTSAVSSVSNVVAKPLQVVKRVVDNPIVQVAASVIPGGTAITKAIGAVDNIANKAKQVEGVIAKGNNAIKTVNQVANVIKPPVKPPGPVVPKPLPVTPPKPPGGGVIKPIIKPVKPVLAAVSNNVKPLGATLKNTILAETKRPVKPVNNIASGRVAQHTAHHHHHRHHTRHHGHRRYRRDLEDDEELSRRDLDAEELFGREYDDFLAERDFYDDLD